VQNIFDNLHGAVPKTVTPRLLDKLSDRCDSWKSIE
jgi:hypothetical protein